MVAPRGVGGVVGVAAQVLVQELGRAPEGAGAAQGLRRRRPISCLVSPSGYPTDWSEVKFASRNECVRSWD